MVTADVWPTLPADPTWIFVVCLCIVVGAILLKAYTANQQLQINGLRDSIEKQADRHSRELADLNVKIERLDARLEEARTERHYLRGEVAKMRLTLDYVRTLAAKCSCGVMEPIVDLLARLANEDV